MNGKTMLNGVPYFSDTQVIELTRAEYDALPNSKYTDGVLYCIKDEGVMKGDTFSPIIYSFAEREVGVWTNGKPLYQKSITIPISSQTGDITYTVDSGLSVVNAFGIIKTTGGFEMVLPASYSNIFYCGLQHDSNYIRLSIYSSSSWQQYNTLTEATVTYQYTKTTDNPGTGKWTTSGVPAHHYSTEEQVIGTWIDGKPICEKTALLQNISISSNSYTTVTLSDYFQNIGKLVNKIAMVEPGTILPTSFYGNSDYRLYNTGFDVSLSDNKIIFTIGSAGLTSRNIYVTLQYTKSS